MPSTVVATVLFTDLVGSTALSTSLSADAAEAVRQTHFALLRSAIQSTGGIEVKNLGDGLMVSFTSPSRAIACAVGIQQGVDNHNRRAAQPLSIRVGVSAGEVTEDDGDYFGDPVVEAARLCAAADGGQILAAEVVRAMVGRHATQTFVEVGPLDLKGLPHPVDAVEVVWEPEVVPGTVPLPSRLVAASNDAVFGFVGRVEDLAEIDDALKAAMADRQARTVLISGEAGIGKTALVAQVARGVHARGVTVLLGRCTEELLVPYQPWIEVMGHLADARPDLVECLSPAHRAALTRFLPALREGSATEGDAETERLVLFEALVRVLELSAGDGSTLVILDDMHWSDAASVQALRHVVASSATLPVVLVCTYRDTDLARGDALTALLADFHREPRVSRRRLVGLDDQELIEYVSAAAGHELDENGVGLAHALRRETGGNPFFTGELLRHLYNADAIYLNDDGRWVLRGELADLELPESVRDVVARRVERLGPDAARILGLAAVIGREFEADVLAAVANVSDDAAIDLLDAAGAAAVVSETDVPLRYRFTHALIQHGLYQDLGASRRQRAHLNVAHVLEESTTASAAELARHWVAATRPSDLDTALKYVAAAGDDALRQLAPEDAIRWYLQALDLLDRQGINDSTRRARLLVGLGTAQRHLGDPEARATLLDAGRLAQDAGNVELLCATALACVRGGGAAALADQERLDLIEAAIAAAGEDDLALRARLLGAAIEVMNANDADALFERAGEAIALAEASGDERALLAVLCSTYAARSWPETRAQRRIDVARGMELAETLGDPLVQAQMRVSACHVYLESAELDAADDALAGLTRLADETGLAYLKWVSAMQQALRAMLRGDLAEAERLSEAALEVGSASGQPEALGVYGGQLMEIRQQQDRQDEILEAFAQVAAENPGIPTLDVCLGGLLCMHGRGEEGRRLIEVWSPDGFARLPMGTQWTPGMVYAADAAASLEDAELGATVLDLLSPFEDEVAAPMATAPGAVARPMGRVAAMLGRHDDADRWFALALDLHTRLQAPFLIARTELEWAECLVARGAPMSDPRVGPALQRTRETAVRYGYPGLERRAAALVDAGS